MRFNRNARLALLTVLAVAAIVALGGHLNAPDRAGAQVDETPPAVSSAEVNLNILTVIFNEHLDTDRSPAVGDFSAEATTRDRVTRTIDITATLYNQAGDGIRLTLASAVAHGETVTLSYTGSEVTDEAGNALEAFDGQRVTNRTPRPPSIPDPDAVPIGIGDRVVGGGGIAVRANVNGFETSVWANGIHVTVYRNGVAEQRIVPGGQLLRTASGELMPVDVYPNPAWSYDRYGTAFPSYQGDFSWVPITRCFLTGTDPQEIDCAAHVHPNRYGDLEVRVVRWECTGPSPYGPARPAGWVSVHCEHARLAYLRSTGGTGETPEERAARLEGERQNCEGAREFLQEFNSDRPAGQRVSIPGGSCSSTSVQNAMERAFENRYRNALTGDANDQGQPTVEYQIACWIRQYDGSGNYTGSTQVVYHPTRQEANADDYDPGRFCNLKQAASAGFGTYREYLVHRCEEIRGDGDAYCNREGGYDWADY